MPDFTDYCTLVFRLLGHGKILGKTRWIRRRNLGGISSSAWKRKILRALILFVDLGKYRILRPIL